MLARLFVLIYNEEEDKYAERKIELNSEEDGDRYGNEKDRDVESRCE